MTINHNKEGSALTIALEGRLDTTTAPELEAVVGEILTSDITDLTLDLQALEYLSSAGLRVVLKIQKTMGKQGEMTVKNVNEIIMEVFEVTGFSDILNIQ